MCRLVFGQRIIDEKEMVKFIKRDVQERTTIDFSRWFSRSQIYGNLGLWFVVL